jgi:hypothetical protein
MVFFICVFDLFLSSLILHKQLIFTTLREISKSSSKGCLRGRREVPLVLQFNLEIWVVVGSRFTEKSFGEIAL